MYGGQDCEGVDGTSESEECALVNSDCEGKWSAYTQCAGTCGPAEQTRTYSVAQLAGADHPDAPAGAPCPHEDGAVHERPCGANREPCPVDCEGVWGPEWGACTASCGGGSHFRNFHVTQVRKFIGLAQTLQVGPIFLL